MTNKSIILEGGENFLISLDEEKLNLIKTSENPLPLNSEFDDKFLIEYKNNDFNFVINGIHHNTSEMDLNRLSTRLQDWREDYPEDAAEYYTEDYKSKKDFIYALTGCGLYNELQLSKH